MNLYHDFTTYGNLLFSRFLCFQVIKPLHLCNCILRFDMRIGIKCHRNVSVSHDILQYFRIHSRLRHIRAKRMSTHMWRNLRSANSSKVSRYIYVYLKHSHPESNQDQPVRSRSFYPLNYESIAVPTGIEPVSKD